MENDTRRVLAFLTAQLVVLVALVHLSLGAINWIRWLEGGFVIPRDARWPAFVVSGFVILTGAYLATETDRPKPYYLAGIAVMVGYIVGYFGWHLGGHRIFLVVGEGVGTETISVAWFLDHLFAGPAEFVAILLEVLAIAGLAALYLTADANGSGEETPGSESGRAPGTRDDGPQ